MALRNKQNRFRKEQTPSVFCELVQCHLRLGDYDTAYQQSVWGLRRFPDSEIVQEMAQITQRAVAGKAMQQARQQIKQKPTPDGYQKLAKYALQVSDGATAMEAQRECLQRFPTYAPAHARLAQLCERRFMRDLAFADGCDVVNHYRKACKLEPSDEDSSIRLIRFYAKIGAFGTAREFALLQTDQLPESTELQTICEKLDNAPAGDSDEDVFLILRRIEEDGRLPGDGQDQRRMQREVMRIRSGLPNLVSELGASRAAIVDNEGEAWDERGSARADAFVNMTGNLSRSAHLATRRAGLGALRGVTLESSGGSLVLRRGARSAVSCLLPAGQSILGSQEALNHLVMGAQGKRS